MPIDLGNSPTGTPPTAEEKTQILSALGIGDAATRSGAENLSNKTLVSPAFSGTATGQLEIATQTAATANSVMTRSIHDDRMFFRAGPRVMPLTCFGTTAVSGAATANIVHGNAVALLTSTSGSVAATYASNSSSGFNVFGLHGANVSGGYGGYQYTRDVLWDVPVALTATAAYSGVLRFGVAGFGSTSNTITREGWQVRIEYVGSTSPTNVRFCTRLGANNATSTNASAVTGATNTSPIVITTTAAHGLSNGESVEIADITGNTAANGIWTVANVGANTFELSGSTGNAAYISGGAIHRVSAAITTGITGGLNRFFIRQNGGAATLVIGDDPTATPVATLSPVQNVTSGLGGTFQTRLNQTGTNASGFNVSPWIIGPVFVSIR